MGTELISGMGEITNYIKQLEEEIEWKNITILKEVNRNKKLKAENKKLEEENKKLKRLGELADFFEKEYHNALQCQADDTEEYEKQIKELKEQLNETDKP